MTGARTALAAAVVAALATAGCGSSAPAGTAGSAGGAAAGGASRSVALVTADVNLSGYQVMRCAAFAQARRDRIHLSWQGTASIAPSDEMTVLQSVLARRPDGVLLIPWDANAFVTPVRQLVADGTPVVTADGSLSQPVDIANVRTDNLRAGRDAARRLAAEIDGRGTVAILTATPGDAVQNARWQGFAGVLRRSYPRIHLLPVQYVGADTGKATSVASGIVTAHQHDLAALYATQDTGTNGAVAALRQAGQVGRVRIVGWDATPETVQLLKAHLIQGLVSQNFVAEGRLMVRAIAAALHRPPRRVAHQIYSPTRFLTAADVDAPSSRDYIYVPQC